MTEIVIHIPPEIAPSVYQLFSQFHYGKSSALWIEQLNLFICHYDKFEDKFSVELSDIPTNAYVLCCYPQSAKERYGLDTIGTWDNKTLVTFNKKSGELSVECAS